MPYGTSIAVGTLCGFVGLATFAMTGRGTTAGAPPKASVQTGPAVVVAEPGAAIATRRIDLNVSHLPPARVHPDLVGLPVPPREGYASLLAVDDAGADAHALRLPIGQMVQLKLDPGYTDDVGRRVAVEGELVSVNDQWVQVRVNGSDQFIQRSQVAAIRVVPSTKPAVAAIEP